MRIESIRVHEFHSFFTLLIKALMILAVGTASIIADINILYWLKPLNVHLAILIFVGVGVAPTALVTWLLSLGRKTEVTPILHVEGTDSNIIGIPGSSPNIGDLFLKLEEKPACVKFTLCEEGIVLYRSGRAGLVRWDNIHKLKAVNENKSFELTIKKTLGRDSFLASDKFDEVRQMLSERVSLN